MNGGEADDVSVRARAENMPHQGNNRKCQVTQKFGKSPEIIWTSENNITYGGHSLSKKAETLCQLGNT
jgi:hypothetical protein